MAVKFPIEVPADSCFPLENIPFGVFSTKADPRPRIATIVGDIVVDLKALAIHGVFSEIAAGLDGSQSPDIISDLSQPSLNAFAAQSQRLRSQVRSKIIDLLSDEQSVLFTDQALNQNIFVPVDDVTLHLPMEIGGFTDCLTSEIHATNCAGFGNQKLHPSFHHFPTAYNGRASSVVVSGTPIYRPHGMIPNPTPSPSQAPQPYVFSSTRRFDFELELGIFISQPIPAFSPSSLRAPVTTASTAQSHIFGFVLLNDWSSRDIQFAEMLPLGPFNSKATATTISPWIVVPEALEHVRCGPSGAKTLEMHKSLAAHLRHAEDNDDGVALEKNSRNPETVLCRSNLKHGTYSPAQLVAHHVSSGCSLQTGDLLGTGTLSGPGHTNTTPTLGCMLELTGGGKHAVALNNGVGGDGKGGSEERMWVEDGDEVVFRGWAGGAHQSGKGRIGFGECRGKVFARA